MLEITFREEMKKKMDKMMEGRKEGTLLVVVR